MTTVFIIVQLSRLFDEYIAPFQLILTWQIDIDGFPRLRLCIIATITRHTAFPIYYHHYSHIIYCIAHIIPSLQSPNTLHSPYYTIATVTPDFILHINSIIAAAQSHEAAHSQLYLNKSESHERERETVFLIHITSIIATAARDCTLNIIPSPQSHEHTASPHSTPIIQQ
jgi:hypothetical protein